MSQEAYETKKSQWGFRKILGIVIVLVTLVSITAGVISQGQKIYAEMKLPDTEEYLEDFLSFTYEMYLDIANERAGKKLSPDDVYFIKERINTTKKENYMDNDYVMHGEDYYYEVKDDTIVEYSVFPKWYDIDDLHYSLNKANHLFQLGKADYAIKDNVSGWSNQSNNSIDLLTSIESGKIGNQLKKEYDVVILFGYDDNGNVAILDWSGATKEQIDSASWVLQPSAKFTDSQTHSMTDTTMVLGIKEGAVKEMVNYYYGYGNLIHSEYLESGFAVILILACSGVLLLAVLLMIFGLSGVWDSRITRIPIEVTAAMAVLLYPVFFYLSKWNALYFSGDLANEIRTFGLIQPIKESFLSLQPVLIYGGWLISFIILYIVCIAILQVFRKGVKGYLLENCFTVAVIRWCVRGCKKIGCKVMQFDFEDDINKTVFKITIINFVIIAFMCGIWVFGWGVLILYTIGLFIFLRKYLSKLKEQYNKLLDATKGMAQGNLNIKMQEDLGLLNPLKEELTKVQEGFAHAVAEEVKSQNMRTELITNVSHDLKTPLTAIITYVDLLKDPLATEEQKNEYIDTLERKAQRLKQLIEDLFEVSKLNSNNVQLQIDEVDIVALLKQVKFEYEEKLNEEGIELRTSLPEEKLVLPLDSQKTYRIFENLFVNVMKYTLPKTRAYLDVTRNDNNVTICMRNISNHEISREVNSLTERFVRGDESRNSEGSGLGLAIVKSLVEKQGGKFEIVVDGDLFKTIIMFPQWSGQEL